MKIFVFGPHGAGKSTFIDKTLRNDYPGFEILKIDDFRQEYGDGTWNGENLARLKFTESIDKHDKNQIIECTGIGKLGSMLNFVIPWIKDDITIIVLKIAEDKRLERIKNNPDKRKLFYDIPDTEFDYSLFEKFKVHGSRNRTIRIEYINF